MKTTLLFTSLLLLTALTFAQVRFVSKTGSSTPPYTSWETASDSIQKCINISNYGDTIVVANGVYKETVVFKQGITLLGSGIDSCIIDTREIKTLDIHIRAVKIQSDCMMKGFYIVVNTPDSGIGIFGQAERVVIENNKITDAATGIYPGDSDILIKNNIFSDVQRAVFLESSTRVRVQVIAENMMNVSMYGVHISFGTKPIIRNNIIHVHSLEHYGSAYQGGGSDTAKVFNNLIVTEQEMWGMSCGVVPTLIYNNLLIGSFTYRAISTFNYNEIKNNVIMNSPKGIATDTGEKPVIQYNNVWNVDQKYKGFTPDSTNLSVDPMMVNEGNSDFHLQMFSPLIDKGDPNILDKDGSRSDIGLFGGPYGESYTYQDLAPKPPRNVTVKIDSNSITLNWLKNTEADFYQFRLYRDTLPNFILDTMKIINTTTDTTFSELIPNTPAKTYYYKITAVDSQNNQSPASEEVAVVITGVEKEPKLSANEYKLYANYPNPFNPATTISYRLKEKGNVKLTVYDMRGVLITTLVNGEKEAGYYEMEYKPDNLASGAYLIVIEVIGENKIPLFINAMKMIFLK